MAGQEEEQERALAGMAQMEQGEGTDETQGAAEAMVQLSASYPDYQVRFS